MFDHIMRTPSDKSTKRPYLNTILFFTEKHKVLYRSTNIIERLVGQLRNRS